MTAPIETIHVDARDSAAALEESRPVVIALHEDEIVQLSLKPSLWFLLLTSWRTLLVTAAAAPCAAALSHGFTESLATTLFVVIMGIPLVRVSVAALQWASRAYLLTNRRIVRFRGVLTIELRECLLARVGEVRLKRTPVQRLLRIGTLIVASRNASAPPVAWEHVSRPVELRDLIERAARGSSLGGRAAIE